MSPPDGVVDDAAPARVGGGHDAGRGKDILRLEPFGSLHYSRRTAAFQVFTPAFTALLLEAQTRHIMDAYKDDQRGLDVTDFILEVARLRDLGILNDAHMVDLRVVTPPPRPGSALSAPMVTNLQVTRACNLHCDHCFVDVETKRHPDELSLQQLTALFGELRDGGAPLVVLAGGEPLMRPDFWEVVEAATAADLDVALCSNATMITDDNAERLARSGLKWFSISLDGPDAAIHDALRGHRAFERAVRGIEALVRADAPGLKLRVTVTAENAPHLLAFAETARALKVPEVVFKPFRHATGGAAQTSLHLYISRAEYQQAVAAAMAAWPDDAPLASFDDGMPEALPPWTQVTPSFGCVGGTTHCSIIYDGRVVACDAIHDVNDWSLHQHGFLDAWHNAPTIRSWRGLDDSGECSSCGNFERCGGGCRARALAAGLRWSWPGPWWLARWFRGSSPPPAGSSRWASPWAATTT